MNLRNFLIAVFAAATALAAHASVESSLLALQEILLKQILPIFAVMAFGFAAFQFFIGSSQAKRYLLWAIVGSAVLFGAQSIVDLISRVVR